METAENGWKQLLEMGQKLIETDRQKGMEMYWKWMDI